jgi:beta-lactamase class A
MRNFVEESRTDAASGRALDVAATLESIRGQIDNGASATLATTEVRPALRYEYAFAANDDKLATVMKDYAQSHSGSYAATLIEISKGGRYASYNGAKQFVTASTYKLFVAYSTLLRVESGDFRWTDSISSGRNLSQCLDGMITLSDNACAEAFIRKIGMNNLNEDAKAIGCTQTIFVSGNIRSTTEDQARLLGLLYSGRALSDQVNRDKLFAAMKVNVYRQGIPKGLPGITVADKVGFLDELLHDSSIVYSPTGDYVLVIYTANATWGNIAELASQLEAARAK